MQAKNDVEEITNLPTMGFGTMFRFLTTELGCFECKFAEFIFTKDGLAFKCKNALKYRQSICWEYGTPRIFDESKKSPEAGLYICECETCGSQFEAYSVMNICQNCFMQAEYERNEKDD